MVSVWPWLLLSVATFAVNGVNFVDGSPVQVAFDAQDFSSMFDSPKGAVNQAHLCNQKDRRSCMDDSYTSQTSIPTHTIDLKPRSLLLVTGRKRTSRKTYLSIMERLIRGSFLLIFYLFQYSHRLNHSALVTLPSCSQISH